MIVDDTGVGAMSAADFRHARDRLWDAVIACDEYTAVAAVFAMLDDGMSPENVLLDVVARVQGRVGQEWAANRLTVAQEHAATAINERVVAALAHHPAAKADVTAGRVTVACVAGEWHALPARLLAEVLRLRGWQVDFLGAQVPTPHLIAHLHHQAPDAVALSCSIATRLPAAHAAITASQAAGAAVLAGGAGFGPDGRYAFQLGANAWAPDARSAADRLTKGLRSVPAACLHQPVDDLPHLADQEFTMVSGTAAQLVTATVGGLADRFDQMRSYDELARQRTVEDIAHIVDFLTTALYVDDDDLFAGFITWTAEILEARGVPSVALHPALDLLAEQLIDFPRSQRLLKAAHTALAVHTPLSADPTHHA